MTDSIFDFDPKRFARRLAVVLAAAIGVLAAALLAYEAFLHYIIPFRDLGYDTDSWFILAAGDYITHNGIPYENPWALVDGLRVVVQQWLHDCILWLLYSENGFAAVRWFQVAMFCAVGASLFAAARSLSKKTAASLLLAFAGVAIAGVYISARPTSWTMLCFIATVAICSAWRAEPRRWLLGVLLAVQLIAANMQISMAPMMFLTACAFLLPEPARLTRPVAFARAYGDETDAGARGASRILVFAELRRHARAVWPLAAAAGLCLPVMLLNPYGLDGALYVVRGLGEASYGSLISELQPGWSYVNWATGPFYAALFLSPLVLAFAAFRSGCAPRMLADPVLVPLAVLWVAGQVGFAGAMRNIWIAALASVLLAARIALYVRVPRLVPRRLSSLASRLPQAVPVSVAAALLVAAPFAASHVSAAYGSDMDGIFSNEEDSGVQITRSLTERFEDVEACYKPIADAILSWRRGEGRDPVVYMQNPIAYSYLEFRGLKVPFDMRPEIWGAAIAGDKSTEPYKAWADARNADDMDTYIKEGGFDFLVCYPGQAERHADLVDGAVVVETDDACLISCPATDTGR